MVQEDVKPIGTCFTLAVGEGRVPLPRTPRTAILISRTPPVRPWWSA